MPWPSPYADIDVAYTTIHQAVFDACSLRPNLPAFYDTIKCRQYTYGRLLQCCKAFAVGLHRFGARKGDVFTMALPNSVEILIATYGASARGVICSGLSSTYKSHELSYHLSDANATFVVACEENLSEFATVLRDNGTLARRIKAIFVTNTDATRLRGAAAAHQCSTPLVPFDELLSQGDEHYDALPTVEFDVRRDVCYLPYSSGTTGMPKGVMVTHAMMSAGDAAGWTAPGRYYEALCGDCSVLPLPMFHMFAFAVMFALMQAGVNIVALDRFRPAKFLQLIQKFRPTILYTAPPLVLFLAKDKMVDAYDVSSLQCVFTAAAPIGKEILEQFCRRHPNVEYLEQAYGMTESVISHRQPKNGLNLDKAGSTGPSVANCKTKIMDLETGAELLEHGKKGEVCLRLPSQFLGYLNRPEETAKTLRDGWLHTGDIGYVDADGHLYVIDRLKELIKVKGYQVPPSELEDVLLSHEAVAQAAVTRVRHEALGEAPVAFIVPKAGYEKRISAEEVKAFVKGKLAPYKQLAGGVHFVHDIPRLASGKILRRKLMETLLPAQI